MDFSARQGRIEYTDAVRVHLWIIHDVLIVNIHEVVGAVLCISFTWLACPLAMCGLPSVRHVARHEIGSFDVVLVYLLAKRFHPDMRVCDGKRKAILFDGKSTAVAAPKLDISLGAKDLRQLFAN